MEDKSKNTSAIDIGIPNFFPLKSRKYGMDIHEISEKTFPSNAPFRKPIPNYPLPTKIAKIFGRALQILTRDHNRSLGLRYIRLMVLMIPSTGTPPPPHTHTHTYIHTKYFKIHCSSVKQNIYGNLTRV
jgi:hypothetical protein